MSMKNSNDTIGNRTRDLVTCRRKKKWTGNIPSRIVIYIHKAARKTILHSVYNSEYSVAHSTSCNWYQHGSRQSSRYNSDRTYSPRKTREWRFFLHTGCPGGNVPDFGRMFLTLKYTDITQNTYVYPKLNGYGDNGERSLKVWQLLHTYWLPNTY